MKIYTLFFTFLISSISFAQPGKIRCSTNEKMDLLFKKDPSAQARFQQYQKDLDEKIQQLEVPNATKQNRTTAIINVPVVVHILIANPNIVTDAIVQRQLDTLNWSYGGQSATDSLRVYSPFRPRFGRTQIRFVIAKRDPNGFPTTGVTRKVTNGTFNDINSDNIYSSSTGGEDAWDTKKYLNIWVVEFNNQVLGYSYLPGAFPPGDGRIGFVADYRAFGSGASHLYNEYNGGKTAVHELGHFFNLLHPWGSGIDNASCTDTDFIGDTPPTSGPSYGCPSFPALDNCSPTAPGKMSQNYMDYVDDACMVLFTKEQAARMETALNTSPDRNTLISSNGGIPPVFVNRDLRPSQFIDPGPSVCDASIKPVIQIQNIGLDTVKSFVVTYNINGGANTSVNFSGTVPFNTTTNVALNSATIKPGLNSIKLYTSAPNGQSDQNPSNDTIYFSFKYITPVTDSIVEGFEGNFPPTDWEITQTPVDNLTWKKATNVGSESFSSAYMNNYNYPALDRVDNLITVPVKFSGADSVYLKFDVSAATYSYPGSTAIPLDTLEVLASLDCGKTYVSIYKKWGYQLQTIGDPNNMYTDEYFPTKSYQWRRDSVNLTSLLGNENTVRFAFRNTSNYENNIFIDNVNFSKKVLPASLKTNGFLINPNPFVSQFAIQHYLPPTDLKQFVIYNSVGQQVLSRSFSGNAQSFMLVDMSNQAPGVYFIKMMYASKTVSHKIVKVK